MGVDYTNLNKIVPQSVKRQVKRKIDEWKKEGIVKGYFAYMIASFTRYTYAHVLELLIYGLYMQTWKKVNSVSNRIFKTAAQDCYDQGRKDLGKEPDLLKWAAILPFLMIQDLDVSYEQYLMTLCQTASEEMYYQVLNVIRMDGNVTAERLYVLVTKQANRILNVKNGKESGIIVDIGRQAGNNGYTAAAEGKDELVMFIAEMDDKTTEMCRSLDGQIFHTNAWNKFTRYSEYYKGQHTFNWFGLERGLNMPPINDHFHWCRSTLTYQLNLLGKEYLAEYNQMRALIPEYLPETFEEYVEKCKSESGYRERMKMLEALKKHFNKVYMRNDGPSRSEKARERLQHISFDGYQKGFVSTRNDIVGTKTSINQEVADLSFHAYDRMIERNVDAGMIKDSLKNGEAKSYKKNPDIFDYSDGFVEVSVSKDGVITTCIKKGA